MRNKVSVQAKDMHMSNTIEERCKVEEERLFSTFRCYIIVFY